MATLPSGAEWCGVFFGSLWAGAILPVGAGPGGVVCAPASPEPGEPIANKCLV